MKKYIFILFLIFLSTYAQAHTSHYKGIVKIELEVFRNNELIGYSNYFFEHEDIANIESGLKKWKELRDFC